MKHFFAAILLACFGGPAAAEMTMTLDWPSRTREGDRYLVELISYETEITGNYIVSASPNESIAMPMGDSAKMCIFALANARPIAVLRGPFHDEIIPIVPDPQTGKICISLFAQKSDTWQVEF